nr:uncharacterized abhydrolase domain-containing protein DDB_G0269086-like [Aegilops tauschii subsp. strangulata]
MGGCRDPSQMSTRELPAGDLVNHVNYISGSQLEVDDWCFGKEPYSRANLLPGSKNAKQSAAATKRQEALKAAAFRKIPKPLLMVSAAPLSLSRAPSGSVIGAADGSTDTHRVDPLATLREASERNAREAQEERQAAARAKTEAAEAALMEAKAAAKAQADAAAKEQADAAAKSREEEVSRSRALESTSPQHAEPPVPEGQAPTRGAGVDQPTLERGGADPVVLEAEVPPRVLTGGAQGSRPDAPLVPQSGDELVVGPIPTVRVPAQQRPDVLDRFNTQGAILQQSMQEFLATRTAVQATADLHKRLGEVESELRTKEQERSQAAQERDRLVKELEDKAAKHQAEVQKLKESEILIKAEYETQRSNWAEREKFLSDGYGEVEDMIDG